MALINEQDYAAISAAIAEVEKRTDAELVTVLAAQSDDYHYIPTLWAALLALLTPVTLSLSSLWLELSDIILAQFAVFVIAAIVFRWPPLLLRLIPASVRQWRAGNLARRQFLDNNLHHTEGETGVLIFVSEAEHYVEIIADRGIDQHVSQDEWQTIVDNLISAVKRGDTAAGFIECIRACGDIMITHAPATHDRNELPDHLVILD